MEANPGTVDAAKLAAFVGGGGNRLSLGVQTHDDKLLALLGRRHSFADADQSVRLARAAGVTRVSLDLIYGLPRQTVDGWSETLHHAISLGPDHISAYCLELHPDTPLARRVASGELSLPGEEEVVAMLAQTMSILPRAGLKHYEIANFSLTGAECVHNVNYWRNGIYLGLGAAAHSHLHGRRWANLARIEDYLAALAAGDPPAASTEVLTEREELLETVMLGIRLREGLATALFPLRYGRSAEELFGGALTDLIARNLLAAEGGRLRLTDSGVFLADYVLRTLACALPNGLGHS